MKIELPCRRELNFHVFAILAFNRAFWASPGASWTLLGLNLEPIERFLKPTWYLLGASCVQLGASWAPLGVNLERLDASWAQLGASWAPSWALYNRLCSSPWPLGRQVELCTAVCAALPGLLGAKLGSVQPFVRLTLASWAPSRALYTFVQLSLAS